MLLAEDPLAMLIARLRKLSAADRDGVLARLDPAERARVDAALTDTDAPAGPTLAPDIVARIAAPPGDRSITPATRAVLLRIAGRAATVPAVRPDRSPAPSLFERLGSVMRRR